MTKEEMANRISDHVMNHIVPQIMNTLTKYSLAFMVGSGRVKSIASEVVEKSGCVAADGTVDVAAIKKGVATAFNAVPRLEMYGLAFTVEDADKFLSTI